MDPKPTPKTQSRLSAEPLDAKPKVGKPSFSDLPDDNLRDIFNKCKPSARMVCRFVNKRFRRTIRVPKNSDGSPRIQKENIACYGSITTMEWLLSHCVDQETGLTFINWYQCMLSASMLPNMEVLRWAWSMSDDRPPLALHHLVKHGKIELLQEAYQAGCKLNDEAVKKMATMGNLEMLQWSLAKKKLKGERLDPVVQDDISRLAAENGHLEILIWANECHMHHNPDKSAQRAVFGKQWPVLEWLFKKYERLDWVLVARAAARFSNVEALTWILNKIETLNLNKVMVDALLFADDATIEYINSKNTRDKETKTTIFNMFVKKLDKFMDWHTDRIDWLLRENYCWNDKTAEIVVKFSRNDELLSYLHKKSCPITDSQLYITAINDYNLPMFEALYNTGLTWDFTHIVEMCLASDSTEFRDWLISKKLLPSIGTVTKDKPREFEYVYDSSEDEE